MVNQPLPYMIKFFRKIRQRLLTENKFSKYLLYAVGEIFLVVIGILIALQINTWNQERKDRTSERLFLTQMKVELEGDIHALDSELKKCKAQLPKIEKLITVLYAEEVEMADFNKSFLDFINTSWYPISYGANPATYEEMKSSGKLGVIKNKELRNSIVILYGNLIKTEKYIIEAGTFGRTWVENLAIGRGAAKFMDYQKDTFAKHIKPEDVFELYQYKEEIINEAGNENWDVYELTPIMQKQLKELYKVVQQIENELNTSH